MFSVKSEAEDPNESHSIGNLVLSIANAVIPLLMTAGAGAIFAKCGLFKKVDLDALNIYSSFFALPFMFFKNLSQEPITGDEAIFALTYSIVCIFHLILIIIGTRIYNLLLRCRCNKQNNGKTKNKKGDIDGNTEIKNYKDSCSAENEESTKIDSVDSNSESSDEKTITIDVSKKMDKKDDKEIIVQDKKIVDQSTEKLPTFRYQGLNEVVTTWVATSWNNAVYVGSPLVKTLITVKDSVRLPMLLDMMFMVIIFPTLTSLLEYCKIHDQNKLRKQGIPVDKVEKKEIVIRILRKVFLSPILWGVILGIIFSFIPVELPYMLTYGIKMIADSSLTVSIFIIGVFFVTNKFHIRPFRLVLFLLMKVAEIPFIMYWVCRMLGLSTKLVRAGVTIVTTIPASVSFATLMVYGLFPDKSPPCIIFGLVLLFPVQIVLQIILDSIYGPYTIVD